MFTLLADDYNWFMWVALIRSMDEALEAIKFVWAEVEATSGKKLSCLRTDHDGEFCSKLFDDYYSKTGVHHQLTVLYLPQQNGMVERHN
jgi:hypothetical protein